MKAFALLLLLAASAPTQIFAQSASAPALPPLKVSDRAMKLHRSAIVLDTHIDTTMQLVKPGWNFGERHCAPVRGQSAQGCNHVDLPRMKEGGLNAAFFSIYMSGRVTGPEAVKRSLEAIDAVRRLPQQFPEMTLATTAAEVRAARKQGKIAVLMGMEGGHMIADSLPVLRGYAALGVRYLTLTHSITTTWADSSSDKPAHDGLSPFGQEVIRELNRLGVMVDISHVSDAAFADALELSRAPIIASHSSARALSGHARNLTDAQIKALAAKGGVVQVNFLDEYLSEELRRTNERLRPQAEAMRAELEKKYPGAENATKRQEEYRAWRRQQALPRVSWEKIVEHIEHVAKIAGRAHVGLGSDFDGATMPEGMEDATRLPLITQALLDRGYSEQEVRGVLGENLLRVMERCEQVAKELDAQPAQAKPRR